MAAQLPAELVRAGTGNCRPDLCSHLTVDWVRIQWFKSEMRDVNQWTVCQSDCLKTHVTAELTAGRVTAVRAHYLKSEFRMKSLKSDSDDSKHNVCRSDYRARDCREHSLASDFRCTSLKSDSIHNDLSLTPYMYSWLLKDFTRRLYEF